MKNQLLKTCILRSFFFLFLSYGLIVNAQSRKTFNIVTSEIKTSIILADNEAVVIQKAAGMFRNDVWSITGQKLSIQHDYDFKGSVIVIGTLGKSKLLKQVIEKYKLATDSVLGKWEAFSIQLINRKEGNLLVVMGSDRRGTAYGILELSRMIGISPWVWWADVAPTKKANLV